MVSWRISFISEVIRVHKATTAANDTILQVYVCNFGVHGISWISSRSTGLKFPI